jgi:cyanophycin synthetase
MFDPLLNPLTLRGLYAAAMGRAFLRFRDARRRAAGRHQAAFYERTWREAAEALGGVFRHLGSEISEIEIGDFRTRVVHNVSAIDDPVTLAVLHDKAITHRLLTEQGIPVPRHRRFALTDATPARAFLEEVCGGGGGGETGYCVVKPAGGTGGGRGVTTGVRSRWQLARAAAAASVYADDLLIEEQLPGDNYRLLYLDGELVDAFVRRPPAVTGDGRSTVAALVRAHNSERLARGAGMSQTLLTVDMDMHCTLGRQGLTLRSVPPAGAQVVLKTAINENCGADNSTATRLLCRSIIEECARAVRALRVRFAGIDLITRDPAVPLRESGGAVIEVNGTPNLYYHYHKRDGCFPIATVLLKRLMEGPLPPPLPPPRHSAAGGPVPTFATADEATTRLPAAPARAVPAGA